MGMNWYKRANLESDYEDIKQRYISTMMFLKRQDIDPELRQMATQLIEDMRQKGFALKEQLKTEKSYNELV